MHDQLRERVRCKAGKKPSPTAAIMDSQTTKMGDQMGERGYVRGSVINKHGASVDRIVLEDIVISVSGVFTTTENLGGRYVNAKSLNRDPFRHAYE